MQRRLPLRWWPLLLVALAAACEDEKLPPGGMPADTGAPQPEAGVSPTDDGATTIDTTTPTASDGGLAPCLDPPTELDRAPSGRLPCELLPPGFVAP